LHLNSKDCTSLDNELFNIDSKQQALTASSCSGLEPNKEGMAYTIPAVHIPNSTPEYIMDSKAIATKLEEMHSSPPLHLDSPVLPNVEAHIMKIMPQMAPNIMPRIPKNILNEKSQGYFEETREKRFGMPLEVLGKEKGGEQAWEAATPHLKEMAELLNETEGPYFMGKEGEHPTFLRDERLV
jgi:glutathione S-transferase